MRKLKKLAGLALFLNLGLAILAQAGQPSVYQPALENLKCREWFQEAKFGLFIHWGLYSILGDGEWVMFNRRIPAADYEKLTAFFNPIAFDPQEWVSLAREAGMRYIVITSRHHDGFSLFETKATDYNVVKATPYGRDILKMLSEA